MLLLSNANSEMVDQNVLVCYTLNMMLTQRSAHTFNLTHKGVSNMEKLFKVGGVSCNHGNYKVRFATDIVWRVKTLSQHDTDVNIMELPHPMTKAQVVTFLKTTELYKNPAYQACIDAADAKYNGTGVIKVKAQKVKPEMSLEQILARAEAEVAAESKTAV
jgi:hypothetical protein